MVPDEGSESTGLALRATIATPPAPAGVRMRTCPRPVARISSVKSVLISSREMSMRSVTTRLALNNSSNSFRIERRRETVVFPPEPRDWLQGTTVRCVREAAPLCADGVRPSAVERQLILPGGDN